MHFLQLHVSVWKHQEKHWKKCVVSGEWDAVHSLSSCLWLQKVWFCLNKRTWNTCTYAWFSTDYYCIVKIYLFLRQRLTRRRYCNCMFSAFKIKTFWELCIYIIDFFFGGGGYCTFIIHNLHLNALPLKFLKHVDDLIKLFRMCYF